MKDLKTEYKKACSEESPDLWNRISENLVPKPVSTKKTRISKRWLRYATPIAAAAVVMLVLPAVYLFRQNGTKNAGFADSVNFQASGTQQEMEEEMVAAQDSAPAEMMQEAACITQDKDNEALENDCEPVAEEIRLLTVDEVLAYDEAYLLTAHDGEGVIYSAVLMKETADVLSISLKEGETYEMTLTAYPDGERAETQVTDIRPVTKE